MNGVDKFRHLNHRRNESTFARWSNLKLSGNAHALINDLWHMGDESTLNGAAKRINAHFDCSGIIQRGTQNAQRTIDVGGAVAVTFMTKPGEVQLPRRLPEGHWRRQFLRTLAQICDDDLDGPRCLRLACDRRCMAVQVRLEDVNRQDLSR
ncbi:MAG: hypothetical protein EOP23_17480 [Hyphomicrobiales bacterium]|nr:MAG: hypothetical protein EOP23_17480 [Hyphomicrobiales bacterium]